MLHIINKSSSESSALEQCLRLIKTGDVILLIEDAVLEACSLGGVCSSGGICSPGGALAQPGVGDITIYALEADLIARGMLDKVLPKIQIIDYAGFVDLTMQHHPTQSWS